MLRHRHRGFLKVIALLVVVLAILTQGGSGSGSESRSRSSDGARARGPPCKVGTKIAAKYYGNNAYYEATIAAIEVVSV